MTQRTKALITLLVCPPILTEIVSGNTPVHALLDPRVAVFLFLAYSWPLLVIRELALRWRVSKLGVFVLGLGYGVLNEGLLAQTLLRAEHVPIGQFDHYVYAGGFNFSWAVVIVPWHALLAVAFPLALIGGLFPSCAEQRWLGSRTMAALAGTFAAAIIFVAAVRKPHRQMLACLFAIAACVVASYFLRSETGLRFSNGSRRALPFVYGAAAYPVFLIGSIVMAAGRVVPIAYFATVCLVFAALAWWCYRLRFLTLPAAARLALGTYFAASVFNATGGIAHGSLEHILTGAILAAVFLSAAFSASFRSGILSIAEIGQPRNAG